MATTSITAALTAVMEERERLQAEIRSLEAQLSEVDAAITSLDRLANDGASATDRTGSTSAPRSARGRGTGRRRNLGRTTPTMVSLIEDYIAGQGRKATHASEILTHLDSMGRAPGGKNPKATLQTTLAQLQKRGRVRNIGRNRWRLVRSRSAGTSEAAA